MKLTKEIWFWLFLLILSQLGLSIFYVVEKLL